MKTIGSLTMTGQENFRIIKELVTRISKTKDLPPIPQNTLYKTVKSGGRKYRSVAFHADQTEDLKTARILFFACVVRVL